MTIGAIKPWHRPKNDDCPQNADPEHDCNCKRIRDKKPYKQVRVREGNRELILRVYPNGELSVHEKRRRVRYADKVGDVYDRAVRAGRLSKKLDK